MRVGSGYARLTCVHENARAIIAHSGVCAIALVRALLVEQSMECPREAWIHALRSSIHGLSESMLCAQHIYMFVDDTRVYTFTAGKKPFSSDYTFRMLHTSTYNVSDACEFKKTHKYYTQVLQLCL